MVREINQRVDGTDIFVFNQDDGNYTFSMPFCVDEAREVVSATNKAIVSDYGNAPGLKGGVSVDKSTGELYNISRLKGIVVNRVLMKRSRDERWLPTIGEGIQLQRAGMYRPEILIDHGLALYDENNPDAKVAQALTQYAGKHGLVMPVLASFKSLGLKLGGERYGVMPQIVSADGLIQGQDAEKTLKDNFRWRGNSGVRRLSLSYGDWDADWGVSLDCFSGLCRVGRISAVDSAKNLSGLIESQIEKKFTKSRAEIEGRLAQLKADEQACIDSANAILNARIV